MIYDQKQDVKFWIDLCDHILSNRFDCDYDEVYAAIIGFNQAKKLCQHQWQIELIEKVNLKLEIALIHFLKLQKYNIKTLCLICEVMHNNTRLTPDFLREVEYLLNTLLMNVTSHFGSNEDMLYSSKIQEDILFPQFGVQYRDGLLQILSDFAYFFADVRFESLLLFNFTTLYVSECINRHHIFKSLAEKRRQQMDNIQNGKGKEEEDIDKENMEGKNEEMNIYIDPLALDGSDLSSMLYFWRLMIDKNPELVLPPVIRNWLIIELQQPEKVYDIEDLNTIYKSFDLLNFDNIERGHFQFFLEKKLFEVDRHNPSLRINHIKEYLELRLNQVQENEDTKQETTDQEDKTNQGENQSEDLRLIGQVVYKFLDLLSEERIHSFEAYSLYYFLHHIEAYNELRFFPNFLRVLPEFVLKNIERFDFDEICYFVLVCHQNSHLFDDMKTDSFWGDLYNIKEHIKSIAFARGFKLDPSSYFSQLLHQVNMADFFYGGEQ